ncbi:MAG: hypothetical protein LBR07_03055, partial [Puniceicoccales bacterium]|nr:hypothetical protein [Puniceicoccales bacterium]
RATPRYALLLAAVLGIAWSVGGGGVLEFWTSPASRVTAGGLQLVLPVDALLFAAGVFAGLFLIPLNAALQAETDPAKMGKTIAVQNLCDYLGMLLAAALLFGANAAGASPRTVFLALGGFMVLVAAGMKFGDATGGAGVRRRRNIGS